jgi:hypothetical protein
MGSRLDVNGTRPVRHTLSIPDAAGRPCVDAANLAVGEQSRAPVSYAPRILRRGTTDHDLATHPRWIICLEPRCFDCVEPAGFYLCSTVAMPPEMVIVRVGSCASGRSARCAAVGLQRTSRRHHSASARGQTFALDLALWEKEKCHGPSCCVVRLPRSIETVSFA